MCGRNVQATIGNLRDLLRSGKPVVVDFWAGWCGPCHAMAPILRALAKEFEDQVVFAKVDIENNRDLASQFNIKSVPTLVLIRNGKEWERLTKSLWSKEDNREDNGFLTLDMETSSFSCPFSEISGFCMIAQ